VGDDGIETLLISPEQYSCMQVRWNDGAG